MRYTTLEWPKLFRYSLLFVFVSVFISAILLLSFTRDWRVIFDLNVQIIAIKLAFIAVIYIAFPLLIVRFCYYFYQLVTHGRKEGISLFCYQTLFNPINFLFRPSLLTQAGLTHRRRCVISIVLLTGLYTSIFAMSEIVT
ncbi:5'-phosphoribosylglycinamide transformylase [Moritella sp. Urea-trap-13]|uniref:5'-phosphoribosylglycinamide transformylase n=1 Tax=Moritella sp. Urea-trap-13 TaxID=2058327 RepID=UPI000C345327|nr:5'-phosphoribosylglycinamide transformylase [Moritella sp. Urea-trap-13]PKH06601.1 5'-phosphoribosylglycinamide transformylase [Moritella sp. Urea-trap-13]